MAFGNVPIREGNGMEPMNQLARKMFFIDESATLYETSWKIEPYI
jgi:hypothetical protein